MNSEIAKTRLNAIVKPDANNTAIEDFFATHVPLKRLQIVNKFTLTPEISDFENEMELFEKYVKNPENKHQMIVVYGQSGTGKSHLIRWFKEMLINEQLENEVILYISRSDNTLKGTIKQLLQKDELKNIEGNEELYKKLKSASEFVDEKKLKDQIYYQFIVEVQNDDSLTSVKQRQIAAFLKDDRVKDFLLSSGGPLERIYSKIDEREKIVDLDVRAEFEPKDFYIDNEIYEKIRENGDRSAQKYARKLISDIDRDKVAGKLAKYLNGFVEEVIQHTTNIEPGDIEQIFTNIRHQLYNQSKNLTIFIEDITSFTGVDKSLLNALLRENEGEDAKEQICRISSIIGSTSSFIQDKFLDNHKDRVSTYIYIPDNQFDENQLYEFVGRYVNAMSLTKDQLNDWVTAGARPKDYPIHDCVEGKDWDYVIADEKQLMLYPFSKNAICNLYNTQLQEGAKTPRYIIRDIIEPVVRESLESPSQFPSERFIYKKQDWDVNRILERRIGNQISVLERLKRFIYIWGDGKAHKYSKNNIEYISGIPAEVYSDFDLPILDFKEEHIPKQTTEIKFQEHPAMDQSVENDIDTSETRSLITSEQETNLKKVEELLTEWVQRKVRLQMNYTGVNKFINSARDSINNYLYETLDWQQYNVSMDNVKKIKDSKAKLVKFDGELKETKALYTLPIATSSVRLIMAFVRWNYIGAGKNFDYYNGFEDAYTITNWKRSVEKEIVYNVEHINNEDVHYIDAAIAIKALQQSLYNSININNLKSYTLDHLYKKLTKSTNIEHSRKWNEMIDLLGNDNNFLERNSETVKRYFNLEQGNSSKIFVIKSIEASNVLNIMKKKNLVIDQQTVPDDIVKRRTEIYEMYFKYYGKLKDLIDNEMESLLPLENEDNTYLDELEIEDSEDFEDLFEQVTNFYDNANSLRINFKASFNDISEDVKKILDAIERVKRAENEEELINKILLLNKPTIKYLRELHDYFQEIEKDMYKVESEIDMRANEINTTQNEIEQVSRDYQESKRLLKEKLNKLQMLRGDVDDH